MKVAVVGSRGLTPSIDKYIPRNVNLIVSGGAKGVDSAAEGYADVNNLDKNIIKPNYKLYGRQAPLVRNQKIVDDADVVLVFWDGKSKGTLHALNYAISSGKEVHLHVIENVQCAKY